MDTPGSEHLVYSLLVLHCLFSVWQPLFHISCPVFQFVCLFVFNGRRVSPVATISPQLEAGVPPASVIPLLIIPFPVPLPPFSPPRSSQALLHVYLFVTRNAPPLVWPRTHPFLLIRLPVPDPLTPHDSPVRYLPQHRWPPVRVQCSGPSARQGSGDCSAGLERL